MPYYAECLLKYRIACFQLKILDTHYSECPWYEAARAKVVATLRYYEDIFESIDD